MVKMKRSRMAMFLGMTSLLAPSLAQAQAQVQAPKPQDGAAQAGGQDTGITDIIVTAQRREEPLQRTPIAVTALTAQQLRAQNIRSVSDLSGIAPNLTISSYSYNAPTNTIPIIYIRGIGQQDPAIYSDPGVPVYADGIYVARSAGGAIDLPDVQRVEVLRGPQGTLFGKNAVGGAVNIVTRTPGVNPGTQLDLSLGNYDLYELRGVTDIKVSDQLAFTVALDGKSENGWGERLDTAGGVLGRLGDQRHISGRTKLHWTPTERLTIDLSFDYSRYNDTAGPSQSLVLPAAVANWNALVGAPLGQQVTQATSAQGRYNNYSENPQLARDRIFGTSATIAYDLGGGITLKSITAYRHAQQAFARDADSGPADYFEISRHSLQRQYTEELQVGGKVLDDKVDFIAGLFYLHDNSYEQNTALISPGLALLGKGPDISRDYDDYQRTNSYAAFTQATWHILPKLSFTAGIRYTEDKKDGTVYVDSPSTHIVYVPTTPIDGKWTAWTPHFALNYQVTPNIMLYTSASRGYKSGGFNERPNVISALTEFMPETDWSYEAGIKSDLARHRIRANLALFRSDYQNIQLTRQTMINGQPVSDIHNVAGARIQGVEGELTLAPVRKFEVSGSFGYLDDKYTQIQPGAIVTAGDQIPYVSHWTFNASARYTIDLGDNGTVTPSVNYNYRTSSNVQPHNTVYANLPAYGLLGARITYAPAHGPWDLSIFGTNLTDKRYLTSVGDSSGAGIVYYLYGKPREVGATLGLHF